MTGFLSWLYVGASYISSKRINNKKNNKIAVVPRTVGRQDLITDRDKTQQITSGNDIPTPQVTDTSPAAVTPTTAEPTKSQASETTRDMSDQTLGTGIPKSISIEKININAQIEEVGLDAVGNMDVPSTYTTVGWYKLGYKVGLRGSAVLSGHYDNVQGKPAVFWDIKNLVPGDIIKVTDNSNVSYTYKVVSKEDYPYDNLPLERIFASNNEAMLNLITCSGTWNKNSRNYSTRTVIYSQLAK